MMRLGHLAALGLATVLAVVAAAGLAAGEGKVQPGTHVVVGVPDTGINPYHGDFYRPDLDQAPCTYLDVPCTVEKLDLSVTEVHEQGLSYHDAVQQDQSVWDATEPGTWYWIPNTSIVAAQCAPPGQRGTANTDGSATCILDDGTNHGTATASSVVRENPDALLAIRQDGGDAAPFEHGPVPVDVVSVSYGRIAPIPLPASIPDVPLYVLAAGNDPAPAIADGWSGHPRAIAVGGGYPERGIVSDRQDEPTSRSTPDVVSWYCRPVAPAKATEGSRRACGTSFAAPTTAGGLSEAIQRVRAHTGYDGLSVNGFVDPTAGIEVDDVRAAMNRTATYDPIPRDSSSAFFVGPRSDHAPWIQWGWGFYDQLRADETAGHLLGTDPAPERSLATRTWMHTVQDARSVYGDESRDWQPDAEVEHNCSELTCSFDASGSSDPNGRALTYTWDLGDGNTATGEEIVHTYADGGLYDVTLTVDNGYRQDTETVTALAVPPLSLSVTTDQAVYDVDDTITVTVEATDTRDDTPVSGLPIDLETRLSTSLDFFTGFANANHWLGEAGVYSHEATRTTDAGGVATWTVPEDPSASPEGIHAPTEPGEIVVTASGPQGFTDAETSYVVASPVAT